MHFHHYNWLFAKSQYFSICIVHQYPCWLMSNLTLLLLLFMSYDTIPFDISSIHMKYFSAPCTLECLLGSEDHTDGVAHFSPLIQITHIDFLPSNLVLPPFVSVRMSVPLRWLIYDSDQLEVYLFVYLSTFCRHHMVIPFASRNCFKTLPCWDIHGHYLITHSAEFLNQSRLAHALSGCDTALNKPKAEWMFTVMDSVRSLRICSMTLLKLYGV